MPSPKIFFILHIRFWPPPCRHWAKAFIIGLSDPSVHPIYQLFGSTFIHLETEADSSGTQQHEPSPADTKHRYPPLHGASLMGFINPSGNRSGFLWYVIIDNCSLVIFERHSPTTFFHPWDIFRIFNIHFQDFKHQIHQGMLWKVVHCNMFCLVGSFN